jgi:hypothetical protein
MSIYDRHLKSMILRQRGQNGELATEILEHISDKGKERLFRIFQDLESERIHLEKKARMPWVR